MNKNKLIFLGIILFLFGCNASQHHKTLHSVDERKVTVGTVQKYIKKNMLASEVASIMGSPNIVTSNGNNSETWIYDRFATDASYSKSSQGVDMMILGIGPLKSLFRGAGAGIDSSSGATSQNQRTLTVIINFVDNQVTDFKYHTSSF